MTSSFLRSLTAASFESTSSMLTAATNATTTTTTISSSTSHATLSAVGSNVLLFVLVFGLSATVQYPALRRELHNKRALAVGLGMQFLVLPLFGFLAVLLMTATSSSHFTQAMGISLLVVVSSPGGSFANWYCSLFNAELALSVALTTFSSLLSVGFLPANLFLYTYLVRKVQLWMCKEDK
jgi:predicted Na+-dependent transporter